MQVATLNLDDTRLSIERQQSTIPTVKAGSCAHANKRAYWYSKLADDAECQFKSLGGSWLEEGQSFVSYLRARRPSFKLY